jgi:hypothetical protein
MLNVAHVVLDAADKLAAWEALAQGLGLRAGRLRAYRR